MTDILKAIEERHSVRQYVDKPLSDEIAAALEAEIGACNAEGGLNMQLVRNEPKAFDSFKAHYGKFSGVQNYIALIGKRSPELDERCGYYGERLVLKAQQLGLNTCWVAQTYSKIPGAFNVEKGEKLIAVIAVGYGKTQGVPHKSKTLSDVTEVSGSMPQWFRKGAEAALLAPTAINQQKFKLILNGNKVSARAGIGFYSKVDLGIVKYHFETAAGKDNFSWE